MTKTFDESMILQRLLTISISLLQALSGLGFFVSVWYSDRALDKSGIGDPERFTFWNQYAGWAFKIFLALWIAGVVHAIWRRKIEATHNAAVASTFQKSTWRGPALHLLLPPVLLFVGWLLILI